MSYHRIYHPTLKCDTHHKNGTAVDMDFGSGFHAAEVASYAQVLSCCCRDGEENDAVHAAAVYLP